MIILAYVDPGLGALIWQSIVAAFVGVLFYFKKTRDWILKVFRKIFGRSQANEAGSQAVQKPPAAKVEAKAEAQ